MTITRREHANVQGIPVLALLLVCQIAPIDAVSGWTAVVVIALKIAVAETEKNATPLFLNVLSIFLCCPTQRRHHRQQDRAYPKQTASWEILIAAQFLTAVLIKTTAIVMMPMEKWTIRFA
jgi:hypothetical protein